MEIEKSWWKEKVGDFKLLNRYDQSWLALPLRDSALSIQFKSMQARRVREQSGSKKAYVASTSN